MRGIIGFAVGRRALLDEWLVACAVLAPAGCLVVAAWTFQETGSWGAVKFFVLYALPLFAAAPLWARTRLAIIEQLSWFTLGMDASVLVLSVARFAASEIFPFSGHMLFLTYTLLTSRVRWYRILVTVLIIETSVFKLLWRDQRSWALGLGLGLLAAVAVMVQQRSTVVGRSE